jgi:hypothetical protein
VERDGHPGDGKRFKVNRDGRGVGECGEESFIVEWTRDSGVSRLGLVTKK